MRSSAWITAVWVLAFVALIGNAIVSRRDIDVLIENEALVAQTRDIKQELALLHSDLKDAETGHRGFIITGDPSYLEPYERGKTSAPKRLTRLRQLTGGDSTLDAGLTRLEDLIADKFREMRRSRDVRPDPFVGFPAAQAIVKTGAGKAHMDRIREEMATLDRLEEDRLNERSQIAAGRYESAKVTGFVGAFLTVGMVAIAYAFVRREFARRQVIESDLRTANADLVRAESQTADALGQLDAFLSNAPIGMAVFDPELRYVRVNEHLAHANGRAIGEHLGQRLTEVLPNIGAQVPTDLQLALTSGRPIMNREVVGRGADPTRVWQSSYFPVTAKGGRTIGVGVVTQDVTERIAQERTIRDSERRKAVMLETALDAIVSIDADSRVIEFNPAAERIFGFSRSEMIGQAMTNRLIPAVHRAGHLRGMAHFLATGEGPVLGRRLELPAVRKDGTEFPAELSITASTVDDRPVFTAYLRDITIQKRAEIELRESFERFRTLADAVPQMVFVTDAAGTVTHLNQRLIDHTGISIADAAKHGWAKSVHADDAPGLLSAWENALANPSDRFTREYRLAWPVEDFRWVLLTAVTVRAADGSVLQWVGTLTDITDQKRQAEVLASLVRMRTSELVAANELLRSEVEERARAEQRVQAAAIELGRSNEELDKFAYVASHDLQEPLRKIQSFGDRLEKKHGEALGPDGRDYVERMQSSAARMRQLIEDLLVFSRVASKAQPFVAVELDELVAGVISDLEARIAQSGGRVELGPLPTIKADPAQMRRLFQNLVANALKFGRPGVPPIVTVQSLPWIDVPDDADPPRPNGVGWRITVADNGIGFENEYAERIFEVFQRLHGRGEYEGTGIGLAICRKIVLRHDGSIVARGRPGEGATFTIDLPTLPEPTDSPSKV